MSRCGTLKPCRRCAPAILGFLLPTCGALARPPDFTAPHHPRQLLVRFKPGATDQARHQVHNAIGATQLRAYRNVDGLVLVRVSPDQLQQAHAAYVGDQRILYAEPDYADRQQRDRRRGRRYGLYRY